MRVPFCGDQSLMAQLISNVEQGRTAHGHVGGRTVPQVVETKVFKLRGCYRVVPRPAYVDGLARILPPWKQQIAVYISDFL